MTLLHRLAREQIIPADPEAVWAFFATPVNLNDLTPPDLKFRILSPVPEKMHPGLLIEYRIQFLPGFWSAWLTEIRHIRAPRAFVDEQRLGPYRFWHHEHLFEPAGKGTRMIDRVSYSVGYGVLGRLLNRFWIRRRLERIFDYRRDRTAQHFAGRGAGTKP